MKYVLIFFLLSGCTSSMSDVKENLSQRETFEIKTQSTDKGTNSYSGDPQDNIHVTASGNARIDLNVGSGFPIKKNEKRDTATEEDVEASFSVDYYLRSIPTTGWALILICLSVLLGVIWWFIKTTMIGKALDASVSTGLGLVEESIDIVRDKLADATKGDPMHSDLQHELARLMKKQGEFKHKDRNRGNG